MDEAGIEPPVCQGGRSPPIPAARVVRHHPAEKTPLRAAQRVGFLGWTAKMGADSGPIRSATGQFDGLGPQAPSRPDRGLVDLGLCSP